MPKFYYETDLPAPMAQCLGRITSNWATLEFFVGHAIGQLLGVSDKEARVIVTQMNLRPKLEILVLLARLRRIKPDKTARLLRFIAQMNRLHARRRELVHGVWVRDRKGNFYVVKHWGGKDQENRITGSAAPVREHDLRALARDVQGLARAFWWWWNNQTSGPLPSRRKRVAQPRSRPRNPDRNPKARVGRPRSSRK